MSLFGAKSIFAASASAEEVAGALQRVKESNNRERMLQEELFSDDICGRIRDAGTRYQALAREFRQVSSQEGGLLVKTKNALEIDLRLLRKSLVRIWGKLCETHKFPTSTRNPDQQDMARRRGLDANAAAEEFQSVLDDVVPRVTALRRQFEGSIRSEGSSGAQCSSNELDLPVLERETLLVASQLRKLECLSDSMDALRLNIVVTAPNGEVICERDATLYASSGTRLTIGALTTTIRDDIEAAVKNSVRIRDADPVEIGIQNVRKAIRETSLPFDSTYSGPPLVGRTGLLEFGFLDEDPYVFENVVFSEAVTSDIGPGKLSLVCKMYAFRGDCIHVIPSILFFCETDEKFYQFPLKCDNISRSAERADTFLHTLDSGLTVGAVGSGNFNLSQAVPSKPSRVFGGFFGAGAGGPQTSSRVSCPAWFQFSDERSCASAFSIVEVFHGKMRQPRPDQRRCDKTAGVNSFMRHYIFEHVPSTQTDGWKQRWDFSAIAAITHGQVDKTTIQNKMKASAEAEPELPKIGEFLKSFTTDTIDIRRIKIVPYGADDLFDDGTAVLDVLRQQDRDDMEWDVRGFIFSSRNAGAHSAES